MQAALRLAERHPSAHFLLVGDAPDAYVEFRQQILETAQPLIAQGRFHTPGWVADMPAVYRSLDVLTLPSRVEGFGLVVAEAGAAGVPCVRSASGGHTETTIGGKTGFVVPVDNLETLTSCLDLLLSDPTLRRRMGQAAREHAIAHFSLDRFIVALTTALIHTAHGETEP